jgi:hypothetical protein
MSRAALSALARRLDRALGTPALDDFLDEIIGAGDVGLALDIGCGIASPLTRFRPSLRTVGLDAHTVAAAQAANAHDHYIAANIIDMPVDRVQDELEARFGRRTADLVTLFGVIEHLPRRAGADLLDRIERLGSRWIVIDTPNGFVPQGPEYGNPYQRHLSGWFPHDFQARGYTVRGSCGTRWLRGYMGEPRVRFPGARLLDNIVLTRLLMTQRFPGHAFNICAVKDLHGVPARYASYDDERRI